MRPRNASNKPRRRRSAPSPFATREMLAPPRSARRARSDTTCARCGPTPRRLFSWREPRWVSDAGRTRSSPFSGEDWAPNRGLDRRGTPQSRLCASSRTCMRGPCEIALEQEPSTTPSSRWANGPPSRRPRRAARTSAARCDLLRPEHLRQGMPMREREPVHQPGYGDVDQNTLVNALRLHGERPQKDTGHDGAVDL